MAADPVTQFESLLANSEFVFVVSYRGHWCPFCMSYNRALQSLSPAIKKAGGVPIIITSEVEKHLEATRKSCGYAGEAIVDPQNKLVEYFKDKGAVDIAISNKAGYEHGMAQPAVLVQKKDGIVLEEWAIVPSAMNMGGAKDRPLLSEIWANAESQLKGEKKKHSNYTLMGLGSLIREKFGF